MCRRSPTTSEKAYSPASARSAGYSEAVWKELGQLGVTALHVPEEHGGFGAAVADLLPVMHEIGRSLVAVPFVSSCVLGAVALRSSAEPNARALLADLATGASQVAWAESGEPGQQISASRHGAGWRLDGTASTP